MHRSRQPPNDGIEPICIGRPCLATLVNDSTRDNDVTWGNIRADASAKPETHERRCSGIDRRLGSPPRARSALSTLNHMQLASEFQTLVKTCNRFPFHIERDDER
jgi:hypothetical protein